MAQSAAREILAVLLLLICIYKCSCQFQLELLSPRGKYPIYVQYGDNLTLFCRGENRWQLIWEFKREPIVPTLEPKTIITRYTVEEPTGMVESKLMVEKPTYSSSTGSFACSNDDLTNQIRASETVTVIYVRGKNQTVYEDTKAVTLECKISGFWSNPPAMQHTWYHDDEEIVFYLGGRLTPSQSDDNRVAYLSIKDPVMADTGWYRCGFIIQVIFPMGSNDTFYHSIYLDATKAAASSRSGSSLTIFMSVIVSMVTLTLGR